MKKLHICPVGQKTDPIKRGIVAYRMDKLILLHDEATLPEAEEIKSIAKSLQIECELVEVNAFDMEDIFSKIVRIYTDSKTDYEIYINITGGTKIMAVSAFIAGFFLKSRVYYIKEQNDNGAIEDAIIELSLPKVPLDEINEHQKRILLLIHKSGDTIENGTSQISEQLEIKIQNVSYHLIKLEKAGLVEIKTHNTDKRKKIINLTKAGRFAAKYFETNY